VPGRTTKSARPITKVVNIGTFASMTPHAAGQRIGVAHLDPEQNRGEGEREERCHRIADDQVSAMNYRCFQPPDRLRTRRAVVGEVQVGHQQTPVDGSLVEGRVQAERLPTFSASGNADSCG
jgi:hypothetical protein